MRLLYVALFTWVLCVGFSVTTQDTPNPSPEHPVFTIIEGALYADVGNGAKEIRAASAVTPLVAVYVPEEGLPVILAKDTKYKDKLIRINFVSHPEYGFEQAGYTQVSIYPFQEPVLFAEDGSIAFIEVASADMSPDGVPFASVVIRNNYDFTDIEPMSKRWMLSQILLVTAQDDENLNLPVLLSYTANLADLSQSLVEVEMPSGERLAINGDGVTLVGEDSPTAEVIFPQDAPPYAKLGETTFITNMQGSFYNQSSHADGNIQLYTTAYQDSDRRYNWVYWVSLKPFKVREVIQLGGIYGAHEDAFLEGHTTLTPNGQTVLYTAYNDQVGASLWKIDLTEQPPADYDPEWDGAWYPTPTLLVSGMPFIADAGNFALPRFVEVTDTTVTLEAYLRDEPAPLPLAYTLEGEPVTSE